MGWMPPTKLDPPRPCSWCQKPLERKRYNGRLEDRSVFLRRKYCDQRCMARAFDERPVKETPTTGTAHWHSRKAIPKGPCQECGAANATDVHHRNRNWRDNRLENLIRLCRSCHQLAHSTRPPCRICGKPQKGHGLCNKHWLRNRRWGNPLIVAGRVSAD